MKDKFSWPEVTDLQSDIDSPLGNKISYFRFDLEGQKIKSFTFTGFPFPLTLSGVTKEIAIELESNIGDPGYGYKQYASFAMLLMFNPTFRVAEFEIEVVKLKSRIGLSVAQRIAACAEFLDFSEKDKIFTKEEFFFDALRLEEIIQNKKTPWEIVLKSHYKDINFPLEIVNLFKSDSNLFEFYMRKILGKIPTWHIDTSDRERLLWVKLAENGLALRGWDIPLNEMANSFSLKQINSIMNLQSKNALKDKKKAVIALSNYLENRERISEYMSVRGIFHAILPLDMDMDLEELRDSYNYMRSASEIILETFSTNIQSLYYRQQVEDDAEDDSDKYWSIIPNKEEFKCAKRNCGKYDMTTSLLPPYHLGCDCRLYYTYKWD